jgi:Phage integrase family
MTQTPVLIEPSLADAIAIITTSAELPEQTRRHWATSLRQIAKAFDKPLEMIPARYSAICKDLVRLHEVPVGLTAKTLRNHKSNAKSALLWLAREKDVPRYGAPLTPAWEALRVEIGDTRARHRLSSFMRYCSAKHLAPTDVDEAVVDLFMEYRRQCAMRADGAFRRLMAQTWNSNIGVVRGWPARRLVEPPAKKQVELDWDSFPEGLQRDIDGYLESLTRIRRSPTGLRIRPLRQTTITIRRAELVAAVRMAVKSGVPVDVLKSLGALLAPEVAEKILDAYWRRNGEEPATYTIDLAKRFFAIAKETKCLDDAACDRLDEMRASLEAHRRGGLTDKNSALIQKVLTPGVWSRVVKLPFAMMTSARACADHSPIRAAVTAQLAVAIAILTVAPVRLANLTAIRLGFNLIKPGGPESNYWLVFPDYDVKNRVKLEFPLEPYLTHFINEYVFDYRPSLLRGSNEDWLFPGRRAGTKGTNGFSRQITERILKATGLQMTVHQFRHAAGALILMRRPGEYELVRRILGHRKLSTTISAYVGLESIQASEIFGKIVMEHLEDASEAAE